MKSKTKIRSRYNSIGTLDKKLKALEEWADRIGFEIDEDILYLEMCLMLTEAEFNGQKKIKSEFWWKLYEIEIEKLKTEN